jgi:galactokinase
VSVWSDNLGEVATAALADLSPPATVDWRAYVLGPFWAMRESGRPVTGADVWIRGEVPFGGGLSSSASIEVALVGLAGRLAGADPDPLAAATIAKLAENGFCRVPCGAMDQVASACGREGCALLLDCRTLRTTAVQVPASWAIVVADSGVKHSVAGEEYAKRQAECAAGMAVVRGAFPDVSMARDLDMARLDSVRDRMDDVAYRRLRHVVTEDERALAAVSALRGGDREAMGRLLYASHDSLRRDYEVSCPELDALVEAAAAIPGVIGCRLTGAGFGGNTVNLVHADRAAAFCSALEDATGRATGRKTAVRVVRPSEGLRVLDV